MENVYFSKWVDITYGELPNGLMESSIIKCCRCGYETNPFVYKWEVNGIKYGRLELPRRCDECKAIMK